MAFNHSARNINLQFRGDGPYLVADLLTADNVTYHTDALRLDNWIANLHGNFQWVPLGNFSATAQNIALADGGATLTAQLHFGTSNQTNSTSTSLSDHVTNSGGFFQVINV
jgi:hypothetical protein